MSRDEIKRIVAQIRRILKEDWDPIGFPTPPDEYDEFVWRVFGLLVEGAARDQIHRYVRWASDDYIKCPVPEARTEAAVDKLMSLDLGRLA